MDKSGVSYTEKEFDYATQIGKPIIGFYHRDIATLPGSKLERNDSAQTKLQAFAKKVKDKLCRPWSTPEELGSAVKSAILNELEFNPRPGWIRADAIPTSGTAERLKQRIADLEERLKMSGRAAPRKPPAQDSGAEVVEIPVAIRFDFEKKPRKDYVTYRPKQNGTRMVRKNME